MTNIDFEGWGEYLGDPPLAMALLDRIVDGALIVKTLGREAEVGQARLGRSGRPGEAGGKTGPWRADGLHGPFGGARERRREDDPQVVEGDGQRQDGHDVMNSFQRRVR